MFYSRSCCTATIGLIGAGMFFCSFGFSLFGAANGGLPGVGRGEEPDYESYRDLKVPPLDPGKALETFVLEEGFRIEVVAHEPMVEDPIAMDIDPDGRLWVVQMTSYMPVHDMGEWETVALEQVPQGSVVVLEDTNGDGKMDTSRTFYDGLILPRAIKVLDDGVLVAEPPRVWLIRDTNGDGRGDSREMVYHGYGDPTSDNVEHMPNGLMWGMDNWIHSSHSPVESLRRAGDVWLTRPFGRLGQWGITQDDWGRMYSSHNTQPLQVHLVPYGYGQRHPRFSVRAGKNLNIAPREPVWPAHPTGVNRGYREGELREDGTLRRVTATCGPVIYRGHQFPPEYRGNAFIPEPAGNMIRRVIVNGDPGEINADATLPYEGREFLTSTDARFRPVNMYNAPDGSLYVIDMYRGIFQHARYLTDYLRDHSVEHDLHKPATHFGRIYRIVREDRVINYDTPKLLEKQPSEWVDYLRHENGLLRDLAQQLLVQRSPAGTTPALKALVVDETAADPARLHALWSLEGFDRSVFNFESLAEVAGQALNDRHPRVRASAIRILEPMIASGAGEILVRLRTMAREETVPFVRLQLVASLGESREEQALHIIADILNAQVEQEAFREMALTGVYLREAQLSEILQRDYSWNADSGDDRMAFLRTLADAGRVRVESNGSQLSQEHQVLYQRGAQQARTCMACHGDQGEGQEGVATALAGSEWVTGEADPLVRIVLHGFEGGDNGIIGLMPPHGFLADQDVAAILTFIRQSWGNDASPIDPEEVSDIREETQDRTAIWSEEELLQLIQ